MTPQVREAVRAAQGRKAEDVGLLNLAGHCSFTDYFLICTGTSKRHSQAISDAIIEHLGREGTHPAHIEGYAQAEWILLDYLNFVVHIFSDRARRFYDLERLWNVAERVAVPSDGA
jgi:ribosome-associated protein